MRSLIFAALLCAAPAFAEPPALVYETYLNPSQVPAEEADAPKLVAKANGLLPTAPSMPRAERKSRGWGRLRFARDLAKATLEVGVTGVAAGDVLILALECGAPGVVGPILFNFGDPAVVGKQLARGGLTVVLDEKKLTKLTADPEPAACPIDREKPLTITTLESLARQGVLYLDLHTKAHPFYGEVRGQIQPAQD
jgi:hypothetical protein